ncbi:leucine aminopeptidase-like [Actinidia eriantha]|uniref:leucine aminopeptidase-like n=1 Tax=Actinidia eriantha TaxID=165200 RepID=UPI002585430D|nr:leucine aminopeptidase-like [Actinidia eriantha]
MEEPSIGQTSRPCLSDSAPAPFTAGYPLIPLIYPKSQQTIPFHQGFLSRRNSSLDRDTEGQGWGILCLDHLYLRVLRPYQLLALDAHYRLAESKDYKVKVAFLQLAISSRCRDHHSEVEKTLIKEVGRMKYLCPLYTALVQGSGKEEEKIFAKQVFSEARDCYHPITQGIVESILSKNL